MQIDLHQENFVAHSNISPKFLIFFALFSNNWFAHPTPYLSGFKKKKKKCPNFIFVMRLQNILWSDQCYQTFFLVILTWNLAFSLAHRRGLAHCQNIKALKNDVQNFSFAPWRYWKPIFLYNSMSMFEGWMFSQFSLVWNIPFIL